MDSPATGDGHRTADQIKKDYIAVMGSDTGELIYVLNNEVIYLHAVWLEYCKLFGKDAARVDFMNGKAGYFFHVVQDRLWDDVLLSIARLTDPPGLGSRENLTLLRLPDALSQPLNSQVQTMIDAAAQKWEFAREHRNKWLAHRDLAVAMNRTANLLAPPSRDMVDGALDEIATIMNCVITYHFPERSMGYRYFFATGDADDLIYHLAIADTAMKGRLDRFASGREIPEDHQPWPKY